MRRTHIPVDRLRRHHDAAEDSGFAARQAIGLQASIGAPRLMAAAGSEGTAPAVDLAIQARSVDTLDRRSAPHAAVMVRAAVASGRAAPAGSNAGENRGGRP